MRLSDSDDAWSGDDDVQSTSQTSNSCVAVEDELREADCREDAVRCFAMGADGAVWATMHGSIYVWHQRGMPDPVLVGDLPDASRLTKMVMTTERQLFIVSTVRVALFNIVDGSDPGSMGLEEVFSFPCPEASTATHVSASPDGALVALSSPSQLLVVPCDGHHRRRLVDQAPFQQEEDEDAFMDSPMYLSVNCNQWYSESGCVCTCFASSERLFVLSASNHLVSVRPEWESQTVVMLRDGHVLTRAHHVVCMSASSIRDAVVVVGLSDGTIKVLQMDTLEVIRTVDVIPLLERQIYPPNQPEGRRGPGDVNGHAWRAAKVMPSKQHGANKHGSPVMSGAVDAVGSGGLGFQPYVLDVSAGHHHVMVAMPDAVLYFDKHSFKLDEERTYFMDSEVGVGRPPKPHGDGESSSSAMCVACGVNGSWVSWHPYTCLLLYYVAAAHQGAEHRDASAAEAADRDVVHAHTALPAKWLEPFLIPSEQQALEEAQRKQKKVHGRRGTADKDKDKPVTFGHPVKSSGYGDVPWSVQQDRKRAAAEKKKAQEAGAANIAKEMRYRAPSGPYTQHPFTSMTSANRYVGGGSNGVHRSAILCSTFTADGRGLLTASGDATGNLLKYPVAKSKGEGVALRGHKAPVLSIDCGLSIKTTLVVTSSSDSSISVWKPEQKEAPFITHQVKGAKDVKVAKFFYQDKFISYVAGSSFHLSRFALDKGAGELNRIRNESCLSSPRFSYRSDAQQITAMASINHFQSNLVVLGGSNKHICVLDVAVEQPLRIIPDAHARAIHSIAMCTHSRYADHVCSLNAQQHFVSAGLDGVVNLWDLRESRCVRQFALHKNNALSTLGLAMSPTGSIIAVGSEDRQVYLYDILCPGTPLDVLKCEDCPTSLAWHGTEPVLAACLASGGITFFGQR